MKERPILFSGPMVRAILKDHKTMTRRVMNPQPVEVEDWGRNIKFWEWKDCQWADGGLGFPASGIEDHSPYGKLGDRLWVRECFRLSTACGFYVYRADPGQEERTRVLRETHKEPWMKWTPSIHMPRVASRLTLDVTGVRVERLQTITSEDCVAEGAVRKPHFMIYGGEKCLCLHSRYRKEFSELWDSINGKRPGCSWDDNPWVWVVEFKKVQ